MRKIILNLAVSLDGYIARTNGSVDWLNDLDTDGHDLGFQDFLSNTFKKTPSSRILIMS
jgi:dihydrofolate reductase